MESFDFLSFSGVGVPNNRTLDNTRGFDNERLLALLSAVETPFGTPKLGWIRALGEDRQVIVYDRTHVINYTYVDAQPDRIVIGTAPKPGMMGGSKKGVVEGFVDEAECAKIDAVDALAEVIGRLLSGGDASSCRVLDAAGGGGEPEPIRFYMLEPRAISLKKRFNIYDEDNVEIYGVESNAARNDYWVADVNGRPVMQVVQKSGLLPECLLLVNGMEIGYFKKKVSLIDVEFNGEFRGRKLKIEAHMPDLDFTIELGGERIGSVEPCKTKRMLGLGRAITGYEIDVYDEDLADEVVSLAAISAVLIQATYQEQLSK